MRILKNTTKLHLFKSLDSLKILKFWEILESKNACLLDLDYSVNKKYTPEQQFEIENTFIRLYDEFYLLRDNKDSKNAIDKGFQETKLNAQILNISKHYEFLGSLKSFVGLLPDENIKENAHKSYDILKSLKDIGNRLQLDYNADIDVNIKMLGRVLNSLQNSLNLNEDNSEKAVKKEKENVFKVVAIVENELARTLPIEDIVCSRWIEYERQAIEKHRSRIKDG